MKKIYTLLLFLFFHSYFCFAQAPEGDNNKVEVIKMGYMTKELDLSPDEAKSFWPVYNNYVNEIKQARKQYPNDEVAFEKRVVQIKEHYKGNFKKVLGNNSQRVNKVYTTDKEFNSALRKELKTRQQNRVQPNQQPEQKQKKPQQVQQDRTNNPGNSNNKKNNSNIKKPNSNQKKPNSRF